VIVLQKSYLLIVFTCLLLVISACSKTEEKDIATNKVNETETQKNNSKETDSADINKEDEEDEPIEKKETEDSEDNDVPENSDPGLKTYQPELGAEKKFTDGEDIVLTEKVVAVNDDYVQLSIKLGGNQSIQIFKWTENEVALVYEEVSVEDSTTNLLDSFTPNINPEILFSTSGASAHWKVLETGVKVDVEYGSFDDVYVLQKVTDEVEDADTIYTRYYAPGYGLVKEIFEVTGENGYSGQTELSTVE
jgi:hypothetical protein